MPRDIDVEGVGRLEVDLAELGGGRLCFKLTKVGEVPILGVEGDWRGPRLAILEVKLKGVEARRCEYGLVDVSIQGEEALAVALIYDRSEAKWRAVRAVLNVVEEELASRGIRRLRLLKLEAFPQPLEGFVDEGWALLKELGGRR